jgi:hypothetical protein
LNIEYCLKQCPIGKEASKTFLNINDSAIAAAFIFSDFTNNCFKTCPFKLEISKITSNKA